MDYTDISSFFSGNARLLLQVAYIIAGTMFILGLKMLGNPRTARKGNLIAAVGMVLAIVGTLVWNTKQPILVSVGGMLSVRVLVETRNLWLIIGALGIGTVLGWMSAKKVQMTSMPQMVSLFNGMGGACAAIISVMEYQHLVAEGNVDKAGWFTLLSIMAGLIIGTVSFAGSMVAYGKLEEKIKDYRFHGAHLVNIGLLCFLLFALVMFSTGVIGTTILVWLLLAVSAIYGILFVLPIGGADMPVVISLLNSFTGVAAAFGGFLYDNKPMLIGGILVGSAGTLLTMVMCKAMNRSLKNVLIGGMGSTSSPGGVAPASGGGAVRSMSSTDVAMLLAYSNRVVIVPGYGLAVAQAQHVCHQLERELESRGIDVKYAIHPVAGRMPGHMNVLLAEADVSYDVLVEMDEINPDFPTTDVVMVVGANDVVNPAAKNDPTSPIYGMPILDVELAKQVIVLKRSMKAGYAGIDNELFTRPNTAMLFGDAKGSLSSVLSELKAL